MGRWYRGGAAWLAVLVWISVLVSARPGAAGNISLDLSAQALVDGGALKIQLNVRNSGDEAAHAVEPRLFFQNEMVAGRRRPSLGPGEAMAVELSAPAAGIGAGRWIYRIMVGYTDANEYPFHALHVATVDVGDVLQRQRVVLEQVVMEPVAAEGTLNAALKNLTGETRRIQVAVYLPEGIHTAGPPPVVELAPWEARSVSVSVVNRTARPGSRYAIFVAAEYEDGATHQVALVPTVLEVVVQQAVLERWRTTLFAGAGGLIVLWVAVLGWQATRRRRAAPPT
jgi:hypothetical protein